MKVTDYHPFKLAFLDPPIVPGADLCLECCTVLPSSTEQAGDKKCTI